MSRNVPEIPPNKAEVHILGNFRFVRKIKQLQDSGGNRISLRNQSQAVLALLLETPGEVVSKETLIETVWADTFVTDDSLVQCIADIRKAIGDSDHQIVQTIPKQGYLVVTEPGAAQAIVRNEAMTRGTALVAAAVVAFVAAGLAYVLWNNGTTHEAAPSGAPQSIGPRVAVVPFKNLSEDTSDAFFSEGLTRDLNSQLSRFSNLFVIASEAMGPYRDKPDCKVIRKELGADYILTGTVQRYDERLRVTTAFTDAETCQQLATPGYFDKDLKLGNVLDIQLEIATKVASLVGSSDAPLFLASVQAKIKEKAPESLDAYECVLLAYWFYNTFEAAELQAARQCLERTVVEESGYSHAWSRLALINMESKKYNIDPPEDWMDRAREAAHNAISSDRENPDAYYALAVLSRMNGESIDVYLKHADRAISLNSNESWIQADLGTWLMYSGNWDKGREWIERARDLNPNLHIGYNNPLHLHAIARGDYEEAINIMLAMGGLAHMNKASLIAAYAHNGQLDEASMWADRLRNEHPGFEADPRAPFVARGMPRLFIDKLMEGLELAGYKVPPQ